MSEHPVSCIYCEKSDQVIPLLRIQYQGQQYWICPQHLPILIHEPAQLADKLPGLELLPPLTEHP